MEIQAALGSDIALVFDECTPFNVSRDYTARSTERTHRWLERCLRWHDEHGPRPATAPPSSSTGSSRAASTRTCAAPRRRSSRRAGATASRSAARWGRTRRRCTRSSSWAIDELPDGPPAPPARHRRHRRPDPRRRARHRHVRLRDAHAPGPPRDGARARSGAALAGRPRPRRASARIRRPDPRRLPLPGLRRGLQPRRTCATCVRNRELTGLRLLTLHNLAFVARLMADLRAARGRAGRSPRRRAALRAGACRPGRRRRSLAGAQRVLSSMKPLSSSTAWSTSS